MTIVALGDSTTAGTPGFRSPREAPPNGRGDATSQYGYWLMQSHPDWTVLNQGIDGQRSDEIGARFNEDVVSHLDVPQRPEERIAMPGNHDISRLARERGVLEMPRTAAQRPAVGTVQHDGRQVHARNREIGDGGPSEDRPYR